MQKFPLVDILAAKLEMEADQEFKPSDEELHDLTVKWLEREGVSLNLASLATSTFIVECVSDGFRAALDRLPAERRRPGRPRKFAADLALYAGFLYFWRDGARIGKTTAEAAKLLGASVDRVEKARRRLWPVIPWSDVEVEKLEATARRLKDPEAAIRHFDKAQALLRAQIALMSLLIETMDRIAEHGPRNRRNDDTAQPFSASRRRA